MLIGLSGKKGAGKSTVASYLVNSNYFYEVSWAHPLKEIIGKQLFGMSDEQVYGSQEIKETIIPDWGKSPRQILQLVGTDWFRKQIHPDFWVKCGLRTIKSLEVKHSNMVVSDNRFPNECKAITDNGGVNVNVVLIGQENLDEHESETALDDYTFDYEISATRGDIAGLYAQMDKILREIA